MKITLLLFFYLIFSTFIFGQKNVKLENFKNLEINYSDNELTRIYTVDSLSGLALITHIRLNEYFVIEDTIHRDFFRLKNRELVIDSLLGLRQSDYTVSYDLLKVYFLKNCSITYLVFEGGDVFPMGSDQQVCYIILKKHGDDWEFIGSYENEHAESTKNIKVICRKDRICLRGKHLKQIQHESSLNLHN